MLSSLTHTLPLTGDFSTHTRSPFPHHTHLLLRLEIFRRALHQAVFVKTMSTGKKVKLLSEETHLATLAGLGGLRAESSSRHREKLLEARRSIDYNCMAWHSLAHHSAAQHGRTQAPTVARLILFVLFSRTIYGHITRGGLLTTSMASAVVDSSSISSFMLSTREAYCSQVYADMHTIYSYKSAPWSCTAGGVTRRIYACSA